MSNELINRCHGRWRTILPSIGVSASALTGKHCPCPICGGKDRFRFDDKAGSGSWFCNQCGAGYGVHLAMKANGWDFRQAADAIDEVLGTSDPIVPVVNERADADVLARAHVIWKESRRINSDNAAGLYLAHRGLADVSDVTWLRFGEKAVYLDDDGVFCGMFPAMLAVLKSPDGEVVGLHRTFLTKAGAKADVPAPRKILGKLPAGAAVQLAAQGDVVGIAEGIETALSATALFDVPCWAAINANGLEKWTPPAGVKSVVIFGDNDMNFAGPKAAYALANRLACKGLVVRVEIPPTVGDDWNDILMKRGAA